MQPLEVLVYEASRQIFDDRYPVEDQPTLDFPQLSFDPIPDTSESFADGHAYVVVEGGETPSYLIHVPAAEMFVKEYAMERTVRDADGREIRDASGRSVKELVKTGQVKRFLRTPEIKAVDGVVLLCMAQYREAGVRALDLEGGKPVELLDNPLEAERAAAKPARKVAAKVKVAKAAKPVAVVEPEPAPEVVAATPVEPTRAPWRGISVEFGPPPVGPPVKRTQMSMFDDEPELAEVVR